MVIGAFALPAPVAAEPPSATPGPASPEGTPQPATSTLRGIVLRKGTGKPLDEFTITIARVRDGEIAVGANSFFRVGWLNNDTPGWLPRYSDSRDVVTESDNKGQFELSRIATPDEPYTLVASNPMTGAALVRQFRPADYHGKPLRVEIDDPSFVRIWPIHQNPGAHCYSSLKLIDDERDADGETQTQVARLEFAMGTSQILMRHDRVGPLIPGLKYELTKGVFTGVTGPPAIIYRHTFTAVAGQTIDLTEWPEVGTTLSGKIRAANGSPLSNVNVMVKLGGSESEILGTLSDNHGRYEITGIPPGKHTLELSRYARTRSAAESKWPQDVSWSHVVAWGPGTNRVTRDVTEVDVGVKKASRRTPRPSK